MNALLRPAGKKEMKEGESATNKISASLKIYLGLVAIMVILTGMQTPLALEINQGQQTSWLLIIIVAMLGWIGVILSPKTGFPEMCNPQISNRQRFWFPVLGGIGLGVGMFLFDVFQPLGSEAQTKFPDSLVIFSFAGLIEEIIIHLFLTTLLIWLISGLLLKGRYQEPIFWVVAAGGAVLYWLAQVQAIRTYFPEQFSIGLGAQVFLVIVVTITAGAYVFRKGGFLAALSLRYGFYLVWHIIWGGGIGLVRYFI
jgi:hypothetical protein